MLIAVISDTHLPRGARRLPEACVERIAAADLLLHAGDFSTVEVLRELEAIGPPLVGVHGNVDSAELRRLLPEERVVEAEGARIAMVHDAGPRAGRLARMRARFGERADIVVFGHSHMPLHEQADDGFQIFNPGSPTERRRAPAHTMGLIDVRGGLPAVRSFASDTVYGIMTPGELIKETAPASRSEPARARPSRGHEPERDRADRSGDEDVTWTRLARSSPRWGGAGARQQAASRPATTRGSDADSDAVARGAPGERARVQPFGSSRLAARGAGRQWR